MITPYVRPQENANRSDVRWIEFSGDDGVGLRIEAAGLPFGVSAWPYSAADLAAASHDYQPVLPRYRLKAGQSQRFAMMIRGVRKDHDEKGGAASNRISSPASPVRN